jgi:hypothetical protein
LQCKLIEIKTEGGQIVTGRLDVAEKQLVAREHFVFTDTESQLFHFSVEGNAMRDGIKIPPEVSTFKHFIQGCSNFSLAEHFSLYICRAPGHGSLNNSV